MMEFKDKDGNVTHTISDEGLVSCIGTQSPVVKLDATLNLAIGTYEASFVTCPKHGEHHHTITSTIKGHEGVWCQICWLESLGDPLPVQRKRIPYGETK
jgi:hypothetical protein